MKRKKVVVLKADQMFSNDLIGIAPLSDHQLVGHKITMHEGFDQSSLRTEVVEATDHEVSMLKKDKTVVGVLPDMPFRHVQDMSGAAYAKEVAFEPPAISWGIESVGAHTLPETAGAGVRVAVLDTGIDTAHPAFRKLDLSNSYRDFTGTGLEDGVGHGTHCAGTIFGADVTTTYDQKEHTTRIGIARGIEEALVAKVLSARGGSTETVADGVLWAMRRKAHVICMSLGLDFALEVERHRADGLDDAPAYSMALANYRENILVFERLAFLAGSAVSWPLPLIIAAAGNSSQRPRYVVEVEPPAASTGILSVAAHSSSYEIWDRSNAAPDLSAPGVKICSAVPGCGLALSTGTSMAAPHATGVAAVIAQRLIEEGKFNADRLRRGLLATSAALPGDPRDVGEGRVVLG